jgi:RHS repeat-associated protein
MDGRAVAVIEGGEVFFIRTDHIGRPVFATNDLGLKVWEASYLPFGGVHVSTGAIALRFPGQWFQSESGLHQNWMRDYDPTTGRYLQADPLGLVDGASVYGYALGNPGRWVDPRGLYGMDGFGSGYGSFWGGLYRCITGHCVGPSDPRVEELLRRVEETSGLGQCILALLAQHADRVAGRLAGGTTVGATVSALGGRAGANKIARALSGVSIGATAGALAFSGDLGYYLDKHGSMNPVAALSHYFLGNNEFSQGDLPCECLEVAEEHPELFLPLP